MQKLYKFAGALPFFTAVFLNAFVDLGHKIVIQNTIFKVYDGNTQVILTAIINGLILLPFILLFSPAGFVSDKHPKSRVMQIAAWAAVVLTSLITVSYYMGWFWIAFAMTFLLAVQSTFYSPAKYGYIKSMFGKNRLPEANGIVQAISIIAILSGTFAFSSLFELWFPTGSLDTNAIVKTIAPIGWLLIATSIIEVIMMYRIPTLEEKNESDVFNYKDFFTAKMAKDNLKPLAEREVIRLSIIGLAMFWSIGQVMLAVFPAFAKETLSITNTVVIQGIIAASGIGIAFGAYVAGKASKNHIETGLVPIGAAGIAIGLWLIPNMASPTAHALNYFFIGTMGGLFIVPLNSLIQFHAGEHELGKILAANNWVQNIGMLTFLILTALAATLGFKSVYMLYLIAIFAVVGGLYTVYKLPQSLLRLLFSYVLSSRYKINVQGLKNIPAEGGVLFLGNHISWIDWAIVQIACPRPIRFVMLASIYERWYLRWFLKAVGCIPIAQGASSKDSLDKVGELLNRGEVVCLFPEGAISRTGHLGTFRTGYQRACEIANDDVVILPFYLRGLWGSQWSRSSDWLKRNSSKGLQRDLIIAFGSPLSKDTGADVLKRRVFDLSIQSWETYVNELPTLGDAWLRSIKKNETNFAIAEATGAPLSPRRLLTATLPFARRIRSYSPEKNIGILLPTSIGGAIANMGVLLSGKTLVNLNYSASKKAMSSAINQAEIQTIYTSKLFIQKLEQRGINFSECFEDISIIFLEDLKEQISRPELIFYWLTTWLPSPLLKFFFSHSHNADDTAAIMFSSGSEGTPKGICLSHRNIMANLKQISDVLNTESTDVVMASLPLFHAFGLTVTQFMPLIEGLPMVCHPDPTDPLGIAKSVAKYQATILCGTSTFLRLFVRNNKVHPLMLNSLRVVVAGAEKLRDDVHEQFKLKFHHDILEGYGATETTPVASVNLPDALDMNWWQIQKGGKAGTVGMALPGSSFKIVNPETFEELHSGESGMVLIGGSQVMKGYLNDPDKTDDVIKTIDGTRWYITGDKGFLDEDGYLTIVDRYSRFAKIAGEMISLGLVEEQVRKGCDLEDLEVVAVSIPDERKGEKIVLLADQELNPQKVVATMRQHDCNPISIPDTWYTVDQLPKLGSGKTDFTLAKHLALELSK
ncbi:MAG: acyl-[ACP]--phospholipid O-acyltransferase [Cellvibrionaceae bacterium]